MFDIDYKVWCMESAVKLIVEIEALCPSAGCHVALTGGCLYKGGYRKDLDILFYRIRQVEKIDNEKLFSLLEGIGIKVHYGSGWLYKASYNNMNIDMLFPENDGDEEYENSKDAKDEVAICLAEHNSKITPLFP